MVQSVDQPIAQPSSVAEDPVYLKMLAQERGPTSVGRWTLGVGVAITATTLILLSIFISLLFWLWFDGNRIGIGGLQFLLVLATAGLVYLVVRASHNRRLADSTATGPLFHPVLDKLLLGPRMMVGGYQRVYEQPVPESEAFLRRCALFVYDLADNREATLLARLVKPGETPLFLDRVIDHLDHRDWIGYSSDRLRVWLSTSAKTDLIRWGLYVGE